MSFISSFGAWPQSNGVTAKFIVRISYYRYGITSNACYTFGGRITVRLVSSLTGLDLTKQENMLFFVYTETTESKSVKLETCYTMILSPTASILC